jgi:lambda family phage portal protein
MTTTEHNNGNGHARLPRGVILDVNGKAMLNATAQSQFGGVIFGGTGYGQYGANLTKNSLLGWLWHGGDADKDIGLNVQVLRERSRDAVMGVPRACAAVETIDTNVIGEGLFPAPNVDGEVLGLDEGATADLNRELADKFNWWATNPRECDYESKHSFYTLQHVAFQSMLLSGDCPVLFPLKARPQTLFELKLRVIEADRIMNPSVGQSLATFYGASLVKGANNIFSGVELSDEGELLAYHISKTHPLALGASHFGLVGQTVRVEPFGAQSGRRNMVLLIKPERPEQRRGVPILAVCLELLKQHGRYIDSTVVAAVIQSYFTAFVTSEFPDPTIFDDLLTEDQKNEITNLNPYNVQLGPGVVNFMRPGHAVNFSTPTQPSTTFGEFTISVAKFIGAAVGIPYEVLLKQFNASYSASRAALLDFWKRVRKYRALVIDQLCQPVYEEWLADAISLSRIERFTGDFNDPLIRQAMIGCVWTGTSAGSLDPRKEVAAADEKVKCGFSTVEREAAELNGSNYRDNIRQSAIEATEFDENDLLYPPYRPTVVQSAPIMLPGVEAAPTKAPTQPPTTKPVQPTPPQAPPRTKARRTRSHAVLASGTSGRFER